MTMHQQNSTATNCIQRIAAMAATAATRRRRGANPDGDTALRAAIDDARKAGVSWQVIGDALGIARGNAYQRYRSRPNPASRRARVA